MIQLGEHPELGKALARYTPHFDLHLVDLGTFDLQDLAPDDPVAALALNLLKAAPRRDDLHEVLHEQRANLRRIVACRDLGAFEASFTYVAQANPRADLRSGRKKQR